MTGLTQRLAGWLAWVLAVAIIALNPAPLTTLRLKAFDAMLPLAPSIAAGLEQVLIVDIDEASQASLGQWPWPRSVLARLTDTLGQAGARVIAFDALFPEPDRLGPSEDAAFASALAAQPSVLGIAARLEPASGKPPKATILGKGGDWHAFADRWLGQVSNIAALGTAAHGLGLLSIAAEPDGVVRRLPLIVEAGGTPALALTIEALRLAQGAHQVEVEVGADGIAALTVGALRLPTDAAGRLWLSFGAMPSTVSAAAVLGGEVPPAKIADKIVLIGASAEGLRDTRTLPNGARWPGVAVHASAIASALAKVTLSRPAMAPMIELGLTAILGLVLLFLMGRLGMAGDLALAVAMVMAPVLLSVALLSTRGLLFDGAGPAVTLLAVSAWLGTAQWIEERRRRAQLRQAFGHYLAPGLVDQLEQAADAPRLGGEVRELTILFVDLRDFTALSERHESDPQALTAWLNRVFARLSEAVLAQEGTIDKILGDGMVVFWNAPQNQPDHARRAIRAARAMTDAMAAMAHDPFAPPRVGIGINTGACFIGNMGGQGRFNYTALGDVVNIAARLQEASKNLDLTVVIGAATAAAAPLEKLRPLGALTLKGRSDTVEAFTL